MLDQLGVLIEGLMSIIPRVFIVRTTHAAIKFRNGSKIVLCGPGLHVYWPLVTEIEEVPTARTSYNVESQALTASDSVPFVASAVLEYRVQNPVFAAARTVDFEETIGDIACAAVADVMAGRTFEQIVSEYADGELEGVLLETCQERLQKYGVEVESAGLTELAPCDAVKHFGISSESAEAQ